MEILADLVDPERPITYGVVKPGDPDPDGVLFIRGGDIHDGQIADDLRTISAEVSGQYRRTLLRGGEIVVSLVGFPGQSALVPSHLAGANLARQAGLVAITDDFMARWVHQFMQSNIGQSILLHPLAGSAQQVINLVDLRRMTVLVPPPELLAHCVETFEEFDAAAGKIGALIELETVRLRGLMQQLLTGRRRLPAFAGGAWEPTRFGELMSESREPGSGGDTARKLTVKLYGKGVTPKRETKSGSNQTQYYRRSAGQFIYSKLDFLNGAFGIVPRDLDGFESTLDLPAFDVSPSADARWLLHFCTRESFYRKYAKFANGGRKARRVNPTDFLKIEEPIPSLDEQRAIADILDTAQREIELLEQLREQIQLQKRGLMQKLLTGEIRVPDKRPTQQEVRS